MQWDVTCDFKNYHDISNGNAIIVVSYPSILWSKKKQEYMDYSP